MNPYEWQQAETMATCAGVEYEDFENVKKNGRINSLGNEASLNMQVKMEEGSWTMLKKVDFGNNGASQITVRAKGEGTIEFRLGRIGAKPSASFNISSDEIQDYTVEVDPTKFSGARTIYLVASSGTVYFDAWQATDSQASGIQETVKSKPLNTKIYDLSGRQILEGQRYSGIVIEQYTDENGVKHSRKVMTK
jgi:arabinoxylan arabinofuranohydrolase